MNIATRAMSSKKPVIDECDTGMLKLVVTIFANEEYVGAVGVWGFFLDDGEVDSFLVSKMTGISEEKVERLTEGIATITAEKTQILVQYIAVQVTKILADYRKPSKK